MKASIFSNIDKKKLRNDLILITSLLAVIAITLTIMLTRPKPNKLYAKITVNNALVETVDLSDKSERHYYIDGVHGQVHVHTHNGSIGVIDSSCPHKDCINMGYISTVGRPIICAYNAVMIYIEGEASYDIEI